MTFMTFRLLALTAALTYAPSSLAQNFYDRFPICCTVTDGSRLVNEEYQCDTDANDCCQRVLAPKFGFTSKRLVRASETSCANVDLSDYNSAVEVCSGPTTFGSVAPVIGDGIDAATGVVNVEHTWIRTPNLESGQGQIPGRVIRTEWRDHTGAGEERDSICRPVAGCNVACVENAIIPGRPLGLYGPGNTCQNAVVRVLANCGCYDTCVRYNWLGQCAEWTWPPLGKSIFQH